MLQLDLTQEETMTLRKVLEDYLSDLRMEIVDTEDMDFREMLKRRKATIMKVMDVLPAA